MIYLAHKFPAEKSNYEWAAWSTTYTSGSVPEQRAILKGKIKIK